MLKTIKKALLLSSFVFSSVFPMRQIAQVVLVRALNQSAAVLPRGLVAQVALARRFNQSAPFRSSLIRRCPFGPFGPLEATLYAAEEGTEVGAKAMAADKSFAMDHQDMGVTRGLCCNFPSKYFAMDHQDMVRDNQLLANLNKGEEIKNTQWYRDRHPEPVATTWQRPSSQEMVHGRIHSNEMANEQYVSERFFRKAQAAQAKNDYFSYVVNFPATVQKKASQLVDSCGLLSHRERLAYRETLTQRLRVSEDKFLSFLQRNPDIGFIFNATVSDLDSASIQCHLQKLPGNKNYNNTIRALELKSEIESIKIVIQKCDLIIDRFETETRDVINKIDNVSSEVIEKEIIPNLVKKHKANKAMIDQCYDEFNRQDIITKDIHAQLEAFYKRPFLAKCKAFFIPDNTDDCLIREWDAAKEVQAAMIKRLQSLYDNQKEYNDRIEHAQKVVAEKKQIEAQEAQRLAEVQQQEAFNQQMLQSYYDSCNFDIADCPSRALEKQWLERQDALSKTKEQGYQQYDQSFNFTPQTAGYLAAQGIDYKQFQSFYGTAFQQQFYGEICSNIERAAGLQRDLPYHSNFLQSSVLLADAAHEANKLGQIQMVVALNDLSFQFLDTVETYSFAVVHGVMHGLQNCGHAIANPVETIQHSVETIVALPQAVKSLAKGVYYVVETAALTGCAEESGFEDLYVDLRDQRNAEIAAGMKVLGEKFSNSTGPEIVEALAQFGTEFYVSGKVIHAVGSALGAVRSSVKAARATEAVAAIAGEQAGVGKAASELTKTVQKMEQVAQEKVVQQVADKLMDAEKSVEKSTKVVSGNSAEVIRQSQTSLENILKETVLGDSTKGRAKQYIKKGGYEDAIKDFESLRPSNVQNIPGKEGLHGILPDGRNVNVRLESTAKIPTIEIMKPGGSGTRIKIRYETKL